MLWIFNFALDFPLCWPSGISTHQGHCVLALDWLKRSNRKKTDPLPEHLRDPLEHSKIETKFAPRKTDVLTKMSSK